MPASFQQQLFAFLALSGVSTAVGIATKLSQTKGGQGYNYSPTSASVMLEAFKLVVSLFFVGSYVIETAKSKQVGLVEAWSIFWTDNFSWKLVLHLFCLSTAYCILHFSSFAIFIYASASMFFLLKASAPVVTALLLRLLPTNKAISSLQWLAILMQCIGLVVTQYDACKSMVAMSIFGYLIIILNITVSCLAGVWNDTVVKTHGTSVNAQNTLLYTCGIIVNYIGYLVVPPEWLGSRSDIGFFDGYNWKVGFVIVANGCVGLVITMVYKYSDVVVKTFGMAGSTTMLFVLESIGFLPQTSRTVGLLPNVSGASVVFYAAFVYMAPLPSPTPVTISSSNGSEKGGAVEISMETKEEEKQREYEERMKSRTMNEATGATPFVSSPLSAFVAPKTSDDVVLQRIILLLLLGLSAVLLSFVWRVC